MTQPLLRRFFNSRWLLVVLPLLLLPTLFLPLGIDSSIFARGGEVITEGGKLYRDYYDQKPPMIYLIYAASASILGDTAIGYRIFDFLWQTVAIILLYTIGRTLGNRSMGAVAGSVYAALYCSMGFSETMQCETFAAPFLAGIGYLFVKKRDRPLLWLFIQGVLCGCSFGLKFTLGAVLGVVILLDFLEKSSWKSFLLRVMAILGGFVLGAVLFLFPLADTEVWKGYMRMAEYIRFYASIPPLNGDFVRHALISIGHFFGDNISLSVCAASFIGIYSAAARHSDNRPAIGKIVQWSILLIAIYLATIVLERKFHPYHFQRLYIPLSLLTGYGLSIGWQYFSEHSRLLSQSWKTIIVGCLIGAVLFSPLPRYVKMLRIMYLYVRSPEGYARAFQQDDNAGLLKPTLDSVAEYIKQSPDKGRTFAFSTNACILYRQIHERPISRFTNPVWFYATAAPKGMHDEMMQEVRGCSRIIIQTNDIHPVLFGHNLSVWECVQRDSTLYPYLAEHFTRTAEFGALYVYERKDSLRH